MKCTLVRTGLLVCGIAAFGLNSTGYAQVTFEGCVDARGIPVASVLRQTGDIAKATIAPDGSPVILYDTTVLGWLSRPTRLWMYAHECAHHALGHTLGMARPDTMEQEADCWAIRTLRDRNLVDDRAVDMIASEISRVLSGTGDTTHLPSGIRARNLRALCLGGATGTKTPTVPGAGKTPGSAPAIEATFVFHSWDDSTGGSAAFDVEIDGAEVGGLDNDGEDDSITMASLQPGTHKFKFSGIVLTAPDGGIANAGGFCQGSFRATKGKSSYRITLLALPAYYQCKID